MTASHPSLPIQRLTFFAVAMLVALTAVVLLAVFAWPAANEDPLRPRSLLPAADIEPGEVRTFALGDTVREVDSDGPLHDLDVAVVVHLVRTEDGELLALDAVIPHPRACHALWRDGIKIYGRPAATYFNDPCLGSTFAIDGTALFGPVNRGLSRFHVRVVAGVVVVDPSRVEPGPVFDARAAVEATPAPTTPASPAASD